MDVIIKKNKIEGPIKLLFPRSTEIKKNNSDKYNMSASVPNIKIVTDSSSRPVVKLDNSVKINDIDLIKDSDTDSVSSGSTVEAQLSKEGKPKPTASSFKSTSKSKFNADDYQNFVNNSKTKERKKEESDDESESGSEDSNDSEGSDDYSDTSSKSSESGSPKKKNSKNEKQKILMKLVSLEKKGIELTKKYSMSSKLDELTFELNLHESQAETEMSVKMQQKILMAAVTGLEFANKKFDPIGAKLDGWSESVMDNIDDYETVFAKLHEKYKKRADLPPELQLLVTLVGGAFMFHVTKTMFSSALPKGLNDAQSSEIMKNISSAMAAPGPPPVSNVSTREISGPSLNLSSMFQRGDDASSIGTVETSREVTVNQKGKRAINL
jgi:hypothetical protein